MRSRKPQAWAPVLLLLGATALRAAEPAALEPDLEAFMEQMGSPSGVLARFREVKELSLLSVPLQVEGTLHFAPPDRLVRITERPARSWFVIEGDRVRFRDEAGSDDVDLSANPVAREFVESFMVLWRGEAEALKESYAVDFQTRSTRWELRLTPRRDPVKRVIEHITLRGEGRTLDEMVVAEADGDVTTTTFLEVETDHRYSEEELARLLAPVESTTDP